MPASARPVESLLHVARASRGWAAFELLGSFAWLGFLGFVLTGDKSNVLVWMLLLLALPVAWKELWQLLRPARFELEEGSIACIDRGQFWSSPSDNVADIRCFDGGVGVTFFDPELVLPEALCPSLSEARQQSGVHFELRARFSRRSLERLAERLPSTVEGAREVDPRIDALTRPVAVVPVLVGLNVVLLVAMVVSSSRLKTLLIPSSLDLMAWGAQIGPLALSLEPWRLLTSTFVHFGVIHLLLNIWALILVGAMAERLLGRLGFALTYLLAGLGGSIAAAISSPDAIACGASGAIFGLFGASLAYAWRQGSALPTATAIKLKLGTVFVVVLNLALGASIPFISQAAHIGGFVAGLIVALPLARPLREPVSRRQWIRPAAVLAVAIDLWLIVLPYVTARAQKTVGWVRGAAIGLELIEVQFSHRAQELSGDDRWRQAIIALLEEDILPRWQETRSLIERPASSGSYPPDVVEARRAASVWADATQLQLECEISYLRPTPLRPDERCHDTFALNFAVERSRAKLKDVLEP